MRRRRHEVHESRFAFHWSWRQHRGENILKKQLGWSCRNMSIYLHRWLRGGASAPSLAAAPEVFSYLTFKGWLAFLAEGKLLLNSCTFIKFYIPIHEGPQSLFSSVLLTSFGNQMFSLLSIQLINDWICSFILRVWGKCMNNSEGTFRTHLSAWLFCSDAECSYLRLVKWFIWQVGYGVWLQEDLFSGFFSWKKKSKSESHSCGSSEVLDATFETRWNCPC